MPLFAELNQTKTPKPGVLAGNNFDSQNSSANFTWLDGFWDRKDSEGKSPQPWRQGKGDACNDGSWKFPLSGLSPQPTSDPREGDEGTKGYGLVLQPAGMSRLQAVRIPRIYTPHSIDSHPFPIHLLGWLYIPLPPLLRNPLSHTIQCVCLPLMWEIIWVWEIHTAFSLFQGQTTYQAANLPGEGRILLPSWSPGLCKIQTNFRANLLSTSAEASDLAKTREFKGVKSPRSVPKPNFKSLWK